MMSYRAKAAAGFPRRPPRRRERAAACLADLSRVHFRYRPRLELMEDRTLLSTFLVNTTADSGAGSLRQAILDTNAATGATSTIDFAISGSGVHMISPASPLPVITRGVLIDGFSQPGYAGTPVIELRGDFSNGGSGSSSHSSSSSSLRSANGASGTLGSAAGGISVSSGSLTIPGNSNTLGDSALITGDGLTITSSDVTVRGLDINSFSQGAGIHITGTGSTGDWIYGNFLGTDPTGTQAEPNFEGVEVDSGSADNTIGGTVSGSGNVISGNGQDGVHIIDSGTTGNVVEGNFIGTDVSGSQRLGNAASGVAVFAGASDNLIGGTASGSGNTISANVIYGVFISDFATTGNVVEGDFIGTDASGALALGNGNSGVVIYNNATNNLIGGTMAAARDVISGNGWNGVDIGNPGTTGNVVEGDFIGVTADSSGALGNVASGVAVFGGASDNLIGGTAPGSGNVISANVIYGVYISDFLTTGNLVEGNEIGTDPIGSLGLGNGSDGVIIQAGAADNTIGGQAVSSGNLITDNGGPGVVVGNSALDDSVGNEIIANRIFANSGQAIDLGDDGVTHDSASTRVGPNNLQNFPAIVTTADGRLQGALSGSTPDTRFRIDVFASAGYGPGGAGEAQDYLGDLEVTTNRHGQAVFVVPFTAPPGMPVVTATATDPEGNTSEVTTALRQATLQSPQQTLRWAPGQTPVFSVAAGDGIILQEVDAGPLDLTWDLTLSVPVGTLTLSSTAGLTGFGDGKARLSYSGLLSTLNAALDGLRFTPPSGFHGVTTLSLDAESDRATPFQAQLTLTDGVFLVNTTADSGPGSLREAILESNGASGASNSIDFEIPGSGVQTIVTLSPLPAITNPLVINGTTQPGYAGLPLIAIAGQPTADADPLTVGSDVTVKGLTLGSFSFPSVSSPTTITIESVAPLQALAGTVTYRFIVAAGEDLLATAQAVDAATSLSLLDAQGHIVVQSDGLSAADRIDAIDTYIGPGTYSLQVRDRGGNGAFTLTSTVTPSSAPFEPIPISLYTTQGVATGDFTGDAKLDLVVANEYSGSISILLGNGDGTFRPLQQYSLGANTYPSSMVVGDFNGDGRLDLAIVISGGVSVLLGNGDGTFQPQVQYAAGTGREGDSRGIVAGDFTGSGHLDLAVAYYGSPPDPGGVDVLLGNGDGTFQPAVQYAAGSGPLGIVAGDFNGDGHLDLAVPNAGSNDVSVFLGNGDGTFQSQATYAVGDFPEAIVTGDFAGDGHLGLAVLNGNSDDVSVLLGNGDGTFQTQVTYGVGAYPFDFVAGDFTGDGKLDLAVSGHGLRILLANGNGTFQPAQSVSAILNGALVTGDFNGDGRLDLVDAGGVPFNIGAVALSYVLLGNGDGTFQAPIRNVVGSGPDGIATGAFTGDGRIDLAVVNSFDNTVSVLLGDADGTFQPQVTYAVGSGPTGIMAGDFNGDGRTDLAIANSSSNDVSVLLGNGDGTFQPQATYAVGAGPAQIVAGDFNGDGHVDLAVTNQSGNTVSVLLGNGDGTFQPQVAYAVGSAPDAILAGDFSGDGHLDLAVANTGNYTEPGSVSVLLGNGDGTFQPQVTYAVGSFGSSIAAGDFNGDGHLDLAVVGIAEGVAADGGITYGAAELSVLVGNGDGTFQDAQPYSLGPNFDGGTMVAGDFNGDGRIDLAFAGPGVTSILLGNGDGTFQPMVTNAGGAIPDAVVAADFNGDGTLDLARANSFSDDVSVVLGKGDGTFVDAGEFVTAPHSTPLVADANGDGTDDVLVVDGAGNILYRQGIPGRPGTFEPPVPVNPNHPSRDIAWLPNTDLGPVLASVDAHDDAISFYAFREGDFVRLSGSLTTGQLPAQIIAANLRGDGWTDLVVRNAGDGTLSVYFGTSLASIQFVGPISSLDPPTFLPPVTLPADVGISDVQAVDTNGSDRLDLVVTNKLSGQVSVFKNLGNGAFAPPVPYRAGTGLSAIDASSSPEVTSLEATAGVAAGPLTPGGPDDLVTINPGSNTMDLLAGLGQGRFANAIAIQTASPAQVVRMGDFTGNGIDDLAVLDANGLSIYLANGHEGFLPPTTYAMPPETDGLAVADVNHDGKLDVLVGDAFGDLLVLLGNGNGTFQPYHEADQAVELAVADLTGNGSKDIIYADQGLDRVVVDYGAGNSTVLANQSTGLLDPGAVKLADMNGDGIPDLIVANSGSNNVLIFPGLGNGQFGPAVNGGNGYFVGTNPVGITLADLTGSVWPSGERRLDLVVADKGSNDVAILLNGGNFSFTPGPRLSSGGVGPVSTVVGNFTGGTTQDLLVTNSGSNNVTLLQGVGGGFFKPATAAPFSVGIDPVQSFVGNFDGKSDLVTVNAGSNDLTLISDFNGPDPVTTTISSGGLDPATAFAFESTSGFEDLVVGNTGDGVLALFEGGQDGLSLMSAQVEPDLPSPTALAFSALTGGEIQFYAATAGREAADLVSLNLAADSSIQVALPGPSNTFAQLVPFEGSSVPLVATVLTLTIEVSVSELSLPLDVTGNGSTGAFLAGSGITVGQGLSSTGQGGGSVAPVFADELAPGGAGAGVGQAQALPWERFVLGLDQVLERFLRENPNGFSGAVNRTERSDRSDRTKSPATPGSPAAGKPTGPPSAPAPPAQSGDHDGGQGSSADETAKALDSVIEALWNDEVSGEHRVQLSRWNRALEPETDRGPELCVVDSRVPLALAYDSSAESDGFGHRGTMSLPLGQTGKDEQSLAAPLALVVLVNEWARWRLTCRLAWSQTRKETMTRRGAEHTPGRVCAGRKSHPEMPQTYALCSLADGTRSVPATFNHGSRGIARTRLSD
jgi:hypothetical protein